MRPYEFAHADTHTGHEQLLIGSFDAGDNLCVGHVVDATLFHCLAIAFLQPIASHAHLLFHDFLCSVLVAVALELYHAEVSLNDFGVCLLVLVAVLGVLLHHLVDGFEVAHLMVVGVGGADFKAGFCVLLALGTIK